MSLGRTRSHCGDRSHHRNSFLPQARFTPSSVHHAKLGIIKYHRLHLYTRGRHFHRFTPSYPLTEIESFRPTTLEVGQ
jgi:hypothetical protein